MQKVINELINNSIIGIDTYRYKDSTWLIFSDDLKWVVELTNDGTLWFNYRFFNNLLSYVSLNSNEATKYITKWAESYFFEPKDFTVTSSASTHRRIRAENLMPKIIKDGIKEIVPTHMDEDYIDHVIYEGDFINKTSYFGKSSDDDYTKNYLVSITRDGIKKTETNFIIDGQPGKRYNPECPANNTEIHLIVSDGIKQTKTIEPGDLDITLDWLDHTGHSDVPTLINEIIDTGVKNVRSGSPMSFVIKEVVNEGIKETNIIYGDIFEQVETIIRDGIKNTYPDMIPNEYNWSDEFDSSKVIKDGKKI